MMKVFLIFQHLEWVIITGKYIEDLNILESMFHGKIYLKKKKIFYYMGVKLRMESVWIKNLREFITSLNGLF